MTLQIIELLSSSARVLASAPLRLGQQLEFLPSKTLGIVTAREQESNIYKVNALALVPTDRQVVIKQWWQLQQPSASARTVPKAFFDLASTPALFKATAATLPKGYVAGSIGWDLWWRPDSQHLWLHVLKGNDKDMPGVSSHEEPLAAWSDGAWLYKAVCFYKTNLVPIGTASKLIQLKAPQQTLIFDYSFNYVVSQSIDT